MLPAVTAVGLAQLRLPLSETQRWGKAGLSSAGSRLQPGGPLDHLPEGRQQVSMCFQDFPVLHKDKTWLISVPSNGAVCSGLDSGAQAGAEATSQMPGMPGDDHRQPPCLAEQTQGSRGERRRLQLGPPSPSLQPHFKHQAKSHAR